MRKLLFVIGLCSLSLFSNHARAGYVEISASTSYRQSVIDDNNFSEMLSTTASASYYFMELSALELSYTKGTTTQSTKPSDPAEPKIVQESEFGMIGADLVLSLASRKAAIQPYIKGGVAQIKKKLTRKSDNLDTELITDTTKTVPSAGVGIKIKITETFSIKIGVDAWENQNNGSQKSSYDYAGRAGVSWLF